MMPNIFSTVSKTIPNKGLTTLGPFKNELKAENPFYKKDQENKGKFLEDLLPHRKVSSPISPNIIPKANLITEIPDLTNKLFEARLRELDITKSDTFGISKKVKLEKPEYKLE